MFTRFLIPALLFFCVRVFAQDIHFSQYNGALLNISPAFTGLFDGDYRIGAIYRSQWQSVPVSYNTVSLYGESRLKPRQMKKDLLGIGLTFNNDRAGDARYGTTQLYANGSYICIANADTSVIVTGGLNLGWGQVGFDYSKMTFDSQYDGANYNSSLPSGEQFQWQKRNFFDMNLGGALRYVIKERHLLTYGLGMYHVTRPRISYQGDELSRLDFKLANYVSYITPIGKSENTDLVAECLFTLQGKNYELIPHASVRYLINEENQQRVLGGLCFRSRDALVVRFGYNYKTMQSGISYDINISRFTPATNRRGGFEIFVNYIIKVKPGFVAKKRLCPLFI